MSDKKDLIIKKITDNPEHGYNVIIEQEKEIALLKKDAGRYKFLRDRDLETLNNGGIFAGITPENVVVNGDDLDIAIDKAIGI